MPFVCERRGFIYSQKLEYNLVDHCNLACRECSHFSPYLKKHELPLGVFVRDLNRLASVFRVERLRFVGGEPLLSQNILDFVAATRASGIAGKIEIVTNGVLLMRAPERLFELIDSLALSVYPSVPHPPELLQAVAERCRRHRVKLKVEHIDRFRRMQLRTSNTDRALVKSIFDSCLIAHTWGCQTFYDGYFYLCSRPIYSDQFLGNFGIRGEDFRRRDGIPLHEPDLRVRLRAYLESKEPLHACRYCLGAVGRYEPHAQISSEHRRFPARASVPPDLGIDAARLRRFGLWHRTRNAMLQAVPSARLARLLNATATAVVGD
jgi:hypothetical protein